MNEEMLKLIGEAVAKVVLDILQNKAGVPSAAAQKTASIVSQDAVFTARRNHPVAPAATPTTPTTPTAPPAGSK